jgi:hypothetical protein
MTEVFKSTQHKINISRGQDIQDMKLKILIIFRLMVIVLKVTIGIQNARQNRGRYLKIALFLTQTMKSSWVCTL